jgi:hypothetical protein
MEMPVNSHQIHARGVELIQSRLHEYGIEYDSMEVHAGIDFRAVAPNEKKYVGVRACLRPKLAGGSGSPSLDWWLKQTASRNKPELVGLTNLESGQAWLFTHKEFVDKAQQQSESGSHLYFYVGPERSSSDGPHERDFEPFVITQRRIQDLFRHP